jgi:hypothetical protein
MRLTSNMAIKIASEPRRRQKVAMCRIANVGLPQRAMSMPTTRGGWTRNRKPREYLELVGSVRGPEEYCTYPSGPPPRQNYDKRPRLAIAHRDSYRDVIPEDNDGAFQLSSESVQSVRQARNTIAQGLTSSRKALIGRGLTQPEPTPLRSAQHESGIVPSVCVFTKHAGFRGAQRRC